MNNRRPQDRATQSGTEGQACLDPEVVAAFLGQRLAADETAALESHIAVCADCRQLISMLVRSGRSEAAARATGATGAGTTLPRAGGAADVGVAMGASIGR